MKRMVINEYGKSSLIKLEDFDPPTIKEGQLLIEAKASSINPVDVKVRSGQLKFLSGSKFPKTLGSDYSGIVQQSKNKDYKEGDEVFGFINPIKGGAYAEQIVLEPKRFALKPSSLGHHEAGVVPIVGLTAMEGLVYHGKLKKGESVFINGCTGGVGSFAVQIAKAIGAEITGTCSGRNVDFAKEIGVDHVLDYTKIDLASLNEKYDVVMDTTGKLSSSKLKRLGTRSARYSTTGFSLSLMSSSFFSRSIKMIIAQSVEVKLKALSQFIDEHNIKPLITQEWTMEDLIKAQREFEMKGGKGKTLIKINS